jgi:hypothetical protein
MKQLLFLLFSCAYFSSFAQEHFSPYKLNDDNRLYYDFVYTNDSLTKNDLFTRSKTWIAKAFKDGKEVDLFSDKEEGLIIGKGSVRVNLSTLDLIAGSQDYLRYTINIFCKDGKARIVVDDIGYFTIGNQYMDPDNIVPLENMYWNYGDVSKKPRSGFKKDKQRKFDAILFVVNDWSKAIELNKAGYSDF